MEGIFFDIGRQFLSNKVDDDDMKSCLLQVSSNDRFMNGMLGNIVVEATWL